MLLKNSYQVIGWTRFRGSLCMHGTMKLLYKSEMHVVEKTNMVEAKVKVKYNYSGFILANIRITDNKGNNFEVHMIS